MNAREFLQAMNGVDDKYLKQADIFSRTGPTPRRVISGVFRWAGAVAAVFVVGAGLWFMGRLGLLDPLPADHGSVAATGSELPMASWEKQEDYPRLTYPTEEELAGREWSASYTGLHSDDWTAVSLNPQQIASIWGRNVLVFEGKDIDDLVAAGTVLRDEDGLAQEAELYFYTQEELQEPAVLIAYLRRGEMHPFARYYGEDPPHTCTINGTNVVTFQESFEVPVENEEEPQRTTKPQTQYHAEFYRDLDPGTGAVFSAIYTEGSSPDQEWVRDLLDRVVSQSTRPGTAFSIAALDRTGNEDGWDARWAGELSIAAPVVGVDVTIDQDGQLHWKDEQTQRACDGSTRDGHLTGEGAQMHGKSENCVMTLKLTLPSVCTTGIFNWARWEKTPETEFALYTLNQREYGFYEEDGQKVLREISDCQRLGGFYRPVSIASAIHDGDVTVKEKEGEYTYVFINGENVTLDESEYTYWSSEDFGDLPLKTSVREFYSLLHGEEMTTEEISEDMVTQVEWHAQVMRASEAVIYRDLLTSFLEQNGMTGWVLENALTQSGTPIGPQTEEELALQRMEADLERVEADLEAAREQEEARHSTIQSEDDLAARMGLTEEEFLRLKDAAAGRLTMGSASAVLDVRHPLKECFYRNAQIVAIKEGGRACGIFYEMVYTPEDPADLDYWMTDPAARRGTGEDAGRVVVDRAIYNDDVFESMAINFGGVHGIDYRGSLEFLGFQMLDEPLFLGDQLTLPLLRELAKKGTGLTAEDFAPYLHTTLRYTEDNGRNYGDEMEQWIYDLSEDYFLVVYLRNGALDSTYFRKNTPDAMELAIDIRTDDLELYLGLVGN